MAENSWWEESAQEFADGFNESPSQVVKTVERRKLDAHSEASVLDNGRVVIQSVNGIEIILGPERAQALLDLLYGYRDLFYQKTHPAGSGE
jgi:hypothetical protein